jgi:hypothetical protein
VRRVVGPERFETSLRRLDMLEIEDTAGDVLLPGAVEAMGVLGPLAAIVTSCTPSVARIAASGLAGPRSRGHGWDVAHGKPDPDPCLVGARRLGGDPAPASWSRTRSAAWPPAGQVDPTSGRGRPGSPVRAAGSMGERAAWQCGHQYVTRSCRSGPWSPSRTGVPQRRQGRPLRP